MAGIPTALAAAVVAALAANPTAVSDAADAPVVRPTGSSVPANLLRLSIAFPTPPRGAMLARLALVQSDGTMVTEPFLDQELWSPDGRMLTVLMHPGRVKSGLSANESLGRALMPGQRVSLALDRRIVATWTVSSSDQSPPDPRAWRANRPHCGTRDALIVELDGPIDALGVNMIAVRAPDGTRVAGRAALDGGEQRWRFTPDKTWAAGRHTVVAAPDLEDPSGNRPGQDFEHLPNRVADMADGPSFQPSSRTQR